MFGWKHFSSAIKNSCTVQRKLSLPPWSEGRFHSTDWYWCWNVKLWYKMDILTIKFLCILWSLDFFSVVEGLSGDGQWLSLTILKTFALMWPEEDTEYSRRLFCNVMLGQNQPRRTPSVEGKDTASWNFKASVWICNYILWINKIEFIVFFPLIIIFFPINQV